MQEFNVNAEHLVIVPGNHDLNWDVSRSAFFIMGMYKNAVRYKKRFQYFSESFYKTIFGEAYPTEYEHQYRVVPLHDHRIVIVGLNSAWNIDHVATSRASINPGAWAKSLQIVRENYDDWTKIAVWHHPVYSDEEARIKETGPVDTLVHDGFRILLHGHVHKDEPSIFPYGRGTAARSLWLVPAGSFGAQSKDLPSAYPWHYNLIRIGDNRVKIFGRMRQKLHAPWKAVSDPRPSEEGGGFNGFWEIDLT